VVIILFGVTGAGKTTVGQLLAAELGWKFYDADEFHSATNVEKMRQGIPLTDTDRWPWLERLRELITNCIDKQEQAVVACSALKQGYREYLTISDEVKLVYLRGNYSLIEERLKKRRGHFMQPRLLQSQFDALEDPRDKALVIDVDQTPDKIVAQIRTGLQI
jgi:gluconokinase